MPIADGPAKIPGSHNTFVDWFRIFAVICVAIAGLVLGWRWLENQNESAYLDNVYRDQSEAAESEKSNLLRRLTADVDERAAFLESHREGLTKRHAAGDSVGKQPSRTGTQLHTPATDQQIAAQYADADVTVLLASDGTPRIVESARLNSGRVEVTSYDINEEGRLMLVVRTNKGRTDRNDRWYFVGGEYADFEDRGRPAEAPPPGGKLTTYRYVPSDESDLGALSDELRAALVRMHLDTKPARIFVPGTAANDWTSKVFPPVSAPEPPPLLPRSEATPAISHDAAEEIFSYTQMLDRRELVKKEEQLAKHDGRDDPMIFGFFDGKTLVKVERGHSSATAKRVLDLYYRVGRLVAVDVMESPTATPNDGTITITSEHFSVVDGRIATYWLEEGGVRAMSPVSQRVQEIEAQARADDEAAQALFGSSN